jgi:hypothetical protein
MRHEEFGLKPPNNSYVDMLERLTHGLHVEVINGARPTTSSHEASPAATERENSRRSSRSNRGERD